MIQEDTSLVIQEDNLVKQSIMKHTAIKQLLLEKFDIERKALLVTNRVESLELAESSVIFRHVGT